MLLSKRGGHAPTNRGRPGGGAGALQPWMRRWRAAGLHAGRPAQGTPFARTGHPRRRRGGPLRAAPGGAGDRAAPGGQHQGRRSARRDPGGSHVRSRCVRPPLRRQLHHQRGRGAQVGPGQLRGAGLRLHRAGALDRPRRALHRRLRSPSARSAMATTEAPSTSATSPPR